MNELQIFDNPEFGEVRTVIEGDKVLFCASDVARALGYARPADAITAHCKGVCILPTPSKGGTQETKFIPEGDIYRLIIRSKLPSAEKFERWVFDEVLPSIRKTGSYSKPMSQLEIMQRSLNVLMEQEKQLKEHETRIERIETGVNKIHAMEAITPENWRSNLTKIVNSSAKNYVVDEGESPHRAVWREFYKRVDAEGRCSLERRLHNMQIRAHERGLSRTAVQNICKLDVIQDDKRLINVAISVMKKMAIQYTVFVGVQ